jgi:hypothetical protein
MSKTIIIPIYNGLRARMFFRTDTYPELLKDPDVRLVIVAPKGKIDYYKKEYPDDRVIFEPLDIMDEHPFGKRLVRLAFNLLPTSTIRGKQKLYLHRYGKYSKFLMLRTANYTLGHLPFIKEMIRFLDRFVPLDESVVRLYEKYKPDIAFIPDIIFGPDRIFARVAKRMGVYIIGTPRSWDNLTSKGFAIAKPDKLLVLTSRMIPEAQKYVGMKKKDIIVTGPPQFDMYYKPSKTSKEEFCKKLGIPPNRKIVLTAPFFDPYTGSAVKIINELTGAIEDGRLPKDTHILVRYRPATPPIKEGLLNKSDHLTITDPCTLSFEVHDLVSPKQDFEWTNDDVELLINSLKYSDTVINIVSTLSIDAMIFDTPVINVRFDADSNCPPRHSVNVMLPEHDHFKAIEATGGVKLAWNMNELIDSVHDYLENPKLDLEKREILRKQQIEFFDGKSGKRVADFIKDTLNYLETSKTNFTYTEQNSDIADMPK